MENVSSRCGKSDNAPRLRFPEFIGVWVEKKLGEIAERVTRKNKNNETDLPLTISSKDGLVDQVTYFNKTVASKDMSGYYLLKNGEFAYNKSYSVGYDFGSIKRLDKYPMGALSTLYICFSIKNFDSDFMKVYFDSLKWYREIYLIAAEGARNHGLLNISTEDFFETKHKLPVGLPEQKKIAAFFTLLDRRIQKQRQLVEFLKTYKRGVIDKFFCNNSYDFELYRLEEIGKFIRGLSYKEDEQTYDNQKTLVLRSNNIRDNGFLNYKEGLQFVTKIPDCEQLLQKNDLVFCMANGSSKLVGKNAVYDGRYNGKITVGTFCCIYRSKFHILQYYFQSSLFQKTLGKIQQGGGGSIGNLKPSDLEPLIVKLPNKYTQEKIFNCLSFFDSYIKLHENKLSSLLSLKSSLLQKMFI